LVVVFVFTDFLDFPVFFVVFHAFINGKKVVFDPRLENTGVLVENLFKEKEIIFGFSLGLYNAKVFRTN
jgi:hypothetical protein